MLAAALELSARGVFDASEITPLREASRAGKLDEMLIPFPPTGEFKGCYFHKEEDFFVVMFEDDNFLFIDRFNIDTSLEGGMMHLYLRERGITCELFRGTSREAAKASRYQRADPGQKICTTSPQEDSGKWSYRKHRNRQSERSKDVAPDEGSTRPRRRYRVRRGD